MQLDTNLNNKNDMPKEIEGITLFTIPETAMALKVTSQTMRTWIKQGKIKSHRIGRPIYITTNNLWEFLQKLE